MGVSYALGVAMARVCFTAFGRWEVQGREAVPPMGPLMVVSNHLSYADPAYLVASIPRQLRFLGKRSLFSNPLAGKMLTNVGVHPVDREEADIGALRWVLNELRRELPLVLFPEGARSRSGGMARGKAGVAYIAARSQAPILPVGIAGTEKIPFWRMPFPLCKVKVNIGEPFTLPLMEGRLTRPILEGLADHIMQRVAALLPPEYRGYYGTGDSPAPLEAGTN